MPKSYTKREIVEIQRAAFHTGVEFPHYNPENVFPMPTKLMPNIITFEAENKIKYDIKLVGEVVHWRYHGSNDNHWYQSIFRMRELQLLMDNPCSLVEDID